MSWSLCLDPIASFNAQVFPDEFHLATLKQYLESCMLLHQGADLRTIFTALMDRLAKFSATFMEGKVAKDKQIEEAIQGMVELLTRYINKAVVERSKMMTTAVFVQTQHSLLNLVLKAYPEDMSAVNQVHADVLVTLGGTANVPRGRSSAEKPAASLDAVVHRRNLLICRNLLHDEEEFCVSRVYPTMILCIQGVSHNDFVYPVCIPQ